MCIFCDVFSVYLNVVWEYAQACMFGFLVSVCIRSISSSSSRHEVHNPCQGILVQRTFVLD